MVYWIVRFIVKVAFSVMFSLKVIGEENIPKKGAFIFASNHRSYLDPMLIPVSHRRRMGFIARESLFKNKFLKWLLPKLETIPIKRESADLGAIKAAIKKLKQGMPVLIFPEGTRVRDPQKQRIQPGIGLLVSKMDLPVVPVYIQGSDEAMPPESKKIRWTPVVVTFGKPVRFSPGESYAQIAYQSMEHIRNLSQS